MEDQASFRRKFLSAFKGQRLLRLHMFTILLVTVCSGAIITKLLFLFNITAPLLRYPLTVLFSYLVFFMLARIWLSHTFEDGQFAVADCGPDALDLSVRLSFEQVDAAGATGEGLFGLMGEGGGVILLCLGLALAIVCGAGMYLMYEAPAILSEVALEFVLASGMIRGMRRMESAGWSGSLFKATVVPLLSVLAVAVVLALTMHALSPGADTIREAITTYSQAGAK